MELIHAHGAVAIGFFRDIVGKNVSFFEYSDYFFPLGWLMMFLIWGLVMIRFKPGKKTIPGLKQKAKQLKVDVGRIRLKEISAASIVFACVAVLALQSFFPPLAKLTNRPF